MVAVFPFYPWVWMICQQRSIHGKKETREKEVETINQFDLFFDRMYGRGHIWAQPMNGLFGMGIDDFAETLGDDSWEKIRRAFFMNG